MDCRRLGSGERTVGADLLRDQLAGTLQELASKQAIKTAAAKLQVPKLFRTLPCQRKGKQQHQKLTPLFVQPRSSCCPETFETVSPLPLFFAALALAIPITFAPLHSESDPIRPQFFRILGDLPQAVPPLNTAPSA